MKRKNNRLTGYILLLAVCLILGMGALALATTMWKWVDDKGVVHYTDELYRVPKKYQSKAVQVEVKQVEPLTNQNPSPPSSDSQAAEEQKLQEAQLKAVWVAKAQNAVAEVKRLEEAVRAQDMVCTKLHKKWELMPVVANREALNTCVQSLSKLKLDLAKAIEYRDKGLYKEAQLAGVPITWFDQILQQK